MLFTELEPSILCPVSMSYAVTPGAARATPALFQDWLPKLASTQYDPRFLPFAQKPAVTMGMGMTEKQGGSDVRANSTRAEFDGDDAWGRRFAITGHKWFMSAPMCDAFLVLAQTPAGLSCFFLPRLLPDGSVNALRIQRLKDKLGNQANASSEVEFEGATAWLVGDEGRGVPQILAMGTMTRLDCALGTAGLMRQALSIALHHTAQRQAFGKRLIEQPMMKNVLADLALESEAATALAMRLARAIDRTEDGQDAHEAVMRRLLTPIAKFWVCKRGSHFAQEAMECLGGNGYVEEQGEGVMARIYREMPLNSIWEGAGNIMALDLLRVAAQRRRGRGAAARDSRRPAARTPALDRAAARAAWPRIEQWPTKREARRLAQRRRAAGAGRAAAPKQRRTRVRRLLRLAPRRRGRCLRPAAGRHRRRRDHPRAMPSLTTEGPAMTELILHHYPMSPFAEKVRLMLGYKQLAWRSVIIPPVMPKPDVVALTGGYRRTPILQIGADVYCDTALIARVLEARQPQPTLYPGDAPLARGAGAMGRRHAVRRRRQLGDAARRRARPSWASSRPRC